MDQGPSPTFLAIDLWSEHTFIVININNHAYDFRLVHEIKTVFPVYVLQKQSRRQTRVMVRWPAEDEPLSEKLADVHNVSGYDGCRSAFLWRSHHTNHPENLRWLNMERKHYSKSSAQCVRRSDLEAVGQQVAPECCHCPELNLAWLAMYYEVS
jgi:hypothetical protein